MDADSAEIEDRIKIYVDWDHHRVARLRSDENRSTERIAKLRPVLKERGVPIERKVERLEAAVRAVMIAGVESRADEGRRRKRRSAWSDAQDATRASASRRVMPCP